jgi:hypothetical protein
MSDLGWVFVVALAALSLASMALRRLAEKSARHLTVYGGTLGVCALGGGLIAHAVDSSAWALGGVIGIASLELGPAVLTGARKVVAKVAGRFGGDS